MSIFNITVNESSLLDVRRRDGAFSIFLFGLTLFFEWTRTGFIFGSEDGKHHGHISVGMGTFAVEAHRFQPDATTVEETEVTLEDLF